MEKMGISAAGASVYMSVMFIGLAVGAPLWAMASSRFGQKTELMHCANIISVITLLTILYGSFSGSLGMALFFILGFSVGGFMLSFVLCREINSPLVMGLAVAFINSGEGLLGSLIEPLIGTILDTLKTGTHFSLNDYRVALSILPCCFVLSSLALFNLGRRKSSAALFTLAGT
jgi:MFS family permease